MFLLDTNVVPELRKARAGRADKNVTAWAAGASAASMFISVITIQELEIGVLLAERRDPPRGEVHGLSVVSRSVADFALTGAEIIDPWQATIG